MITLNQIKTLLNGVTSKIPPFVKPNWNENNENSPNFIKNRTHWREEEEKLRKIIGPLTLYCGGDGYSEQQEGHPGLELGKIYVVTFDGTQYECEPRVYEDDALLIGNGTIYGDDNPGNNEPFSIDFYQESFNTYSFYLNVRGSGEHTIAIHLKEKITNFHRLEEGYLPLKLPSSYEDEVKSAIRQSGVNEQVIYRLENDNYPAALPFNSQYGEVRALWDSSSPWDGYPAGWRYFKYPKAEDIVTAIGNVYDFQVAQSSEPVDGEYYQKAGLYLWARIYDYDENYGQYYHICKVENGLTLRNNADASTLYFGTDEDLNLTITHGLSGEIIKITVDSPGNIILIDGDGVAITPNSFNSKQFGTFYLSPLRLISTYSAPLLYVRKNSTMLMSEPDKYYVQTYGAFKNYAVGELFSVSYPSNNLLFWEDYEWPNYGYMAARGKMFFWLDKKYKCQITSAKYRTTDSDTSDVMEYESPDWIMEFSGVNEVTEEDGLRYKITMNGKFFFKRTKRPGFWMKLTKFEKVLLPCVPPYSSSDEGKILSITNGTPNWKEAGPQTAQEGEYELIASFTDKTEIQPLDYTFSSGLSALYIYIVNRSSGSVKIGTQFSCGNNSYSSSTTLSTNFSTTLEVFFERGALDYNSLGSSSRTKAFNLATKTITKLKIGLYDGMNLDTITPIPAGVEIKIYGVYKQ